MSVKPRRKNRPARCECFVIVLTAGWSIAAAQTNEPGWAQALKKLSLEELVNQEVTLVTKKLERLSESPSAVQVLTGEDIRRSAAMDLPEALRLAPNLEVAQQNAHDWAITARGFNGAPFANNSLAAGWLGSSETGRCPWQGRICGSLTTRNLVRSKFPGVFTARLLFGSSRSRPWPP